MKNRENNKMNFDNRYFELVNLLDLEEQDELAQKVFASIEETPILVEVNTLKIIKYPVSGIEIYLGNKVIHRISLLSNYSGCLLAGIAFDDHRDLVRSKLASMSISSQLSENENSECNQKDIYKLESYEIQLEYERNSLKLSSVFLAPLGSWF